MWAWIVRLFGGFNIFGGKELGERLGKIIYVAIICVVILAISCGVFWKVFLEQRIKNIENYQGSTVTNIHDCSGPVQEAVKKAQYKPLIDIKVWKVIRIGIGDKNG